MKKKLFALLLSCCLFASSSTVFASSVDISNMSLEELQDAYKELETKYNELAGIDDPESMVTQEPVDTSAGIFEIDVAAGFYTAGIDIPYGTYSLSAVSGSGNVHSRKCGLNEIMANPKDEWSIDSYNGAKFDNGSILEISGDLVLHIKSDNAQINNMTLRAVSAEVQTDLSAGNYTAGTDFPIGTYNVTALEGSGNVHSREADLNEIFSIDATEGWGVSQVSNVKFEEGAVLEVSSCSIRLVPVGE